MHLATEELRQLKPTLRNDDVTVNDITDVGLSFVGAWQKRGFTSLNGFVAGISIDTGHVIDVQPMSRYCQVCHCSQFQRH